MCGIVGIAGLNPLEPVDETRLKIMRDVLRHRGPDGEGLWTEAHVGLGFRRLAIIDVEGGAQPMPNEDGSVWVVFNGEIYNHAKLRPWLETRGHHYRTRSDTETIVHLYEEEGERCVEKLQGMFAFAVWDRPRQRLLLARDQLGIKPLYYALTVRELDFAAAIRAILASSAVAPALNRAIVPEFLANRYVAGAETFFRGVMKLLPGRTLTWSAREGVRERRYWRLPTEVNDTPTTPVEAAGMVRAGLEATVRSHLMSDVPLGLFLSGGGSDEMFLGYHRYRITNWNDRLGRVYRRLAPSGLRGSIGRSLGRLPRRLGRYATRTFLGLPPGPRHLFYENFAVFPTTLQQSLLADPELLAARDPYQEALERYADAPGGDLDRMSHADLQTYLVELLMKQDQMSMAASIESRVPFLDHEFVERVAAMPGRTKLRGWQTKAVLRAAIQDVVPRAILTRRKMGFPVPVGRWLRGPFRPLVDELVLGPRALERGLFDPAALRRLAEAHRSGAAEHGDRLWLLINLELWQRMFLDGEDVGDVLHGPETSYA